MYTLKKGVMVLAVVFIMLLSLLVKNGLLKRSSKTLVLMVGINIGHFSFRRFLGLRLNFIL